MAQAIDGVVGFTSGGSEDVFAALVRAGECDNVWAMCMHQGTHSNGTLTLGGVDSRLYDGPIACNTHTHVHPLELVSN